MTIDDPIPSERSHFTRSPAPWVAGSSDIGRKHRTNQDALCLAARDLPSRMAVLAVSDGVSTAPGSEVASLVASEAAVAGLTSGIQDDVAHNVSFVEAFQAAHDAVLGAAMEGDEPSACTLIAAILEPGVITVGNVGDTRAYWVGDDGSARLLSTDDSMAQARIMLGMSREDAETSRQAHSITKWLGRDSTNVVPTLVTFQPTGNGWLVLCSDGLWNYASSVEEMATLVTSTVQQNPAPTEMTQSLVEWAKQQGGRDNITVAIARYES